MRPRPHTPMSVLMLGLTLGAGAAPPADAAPRRLKLVPTTTQTRQWPVDVNGWWGLIDEKGNLNTEPDLDWIGVMVDGQAPAALGGRFGVVDGLGRWRVDPRYEKVDRFSGGYAVFRRDGKAGFLNVAGDEALRPELEDARRFREGFAAVRTAAGCGYLDASMEPVVPPVFAVARSLHQGLGVVAVGVPAAGTATARALERLSGTRLDELIDAGVRAGAADDDPAAGPARLWGCVDKSGRLVWLDRTGRVEAVGDFGDNLAPVRVDGTWGFINRAFQLAIEPQWDEARPFVNGYAAVRRGEKWGYVNPAGRVAIEPRWDEADDFDESLAMVRDGERWGYIDVSGRVAIEPQFSEAEPFFRGRARVNAGWNQRPDAFGYINVAGQIVFDPRHAGPGFVDLRRGGTGEILVNDTFAGPDPFGPGRRSRVVTAPPPRPTPGVGVPPEHLYDGGVSIDHADPAFATDPASDQMPHD